MLMFGVPCWKWTLNFKELIYLQCTVYTSKILVDTEFVLFLCFSI